MTAYDLRTNVAVPELLMEQNICTVIDVDFSVTNRLSADTIKLLTFDAGVLVKNVNVILLTAEGGACDNHTLGDSASANGYDASMNFNGTQYVAYHPVDGTDAYANGKYYGAADYLLLTLGANVATAKIRVVVDMVRTTY